MYLWGKGGKGGGGDGAKYEVSSYRLPASSRGALEFGALVDRGGNPAPGSVRPADAVKLGKHTRLGFLPSKREWQRRRKGGVWGGAA